MSLWRGPLIDPPKTIPNNRYVTHFRLADNPVPMKPETIYGKVNIKSLEQYRNKVQIGDEDSPVLLIDMESDIRQ